MNEITKVLIPTYFSESSLIQLESFIQNNHENSLNTREWFHNIQTIQ